MPIKDRLKELRALAGLTQQELATKAGLSISGVVQVELGKIPDPRVSTLAALARALGCTVDDLLGGPEDEPPAPKKPSGKKPKK